MYLNNIINKIQSYTTELPAWNAQKKLSPPYRIDYDLEEIKKTNPRVAAVLILLYENEEGELEFPIILRKAYEGVHSNQYALPGGSFEPEDLSLSQTAVRETVEELGLEHEQIEVIKQLTELYIPPSNFLVYPYIGVYHGTPEFFPQESEVELIIPINVEAMVHAEHTTFEKSFSGNKVDIPAYEIGENEYIWGATAMILSEFSLFIKKI